MPDQFGQIFISDQFDAKAVEVIQKWVDTYLSQVERLSSIATRSIDRPKSYNVVIDPEKFPEDATPTIMVVSTGLGGSLERVGDGQYNGWWNWVVVCIVSFRDEESTRKAAQLYAAAVRSLIVQKAAREGLGDTTFVDESLDHAPVTGRDRTMAVAALEFNTYIEGIVTEPEGPLEPDAEVPVGDPNAPYPDWPLVETTYIEIANEPIN